jgi:hypothetical protein
VSKKREDRSDGEVVSRYLRVLGALGPHANDLVLRYKESTGVDLSEAVSRTRGLCCKDIDPLGLGSDRGFAYIMCVVGLSFGIGGIFVAICLLGLGIAIHVQADRQMDRFFLDRLHLTNASRHFEFMARQLEGKEGVAKDIIPARVHAVAICHVSGMETLQYFRSFVDMASFLGFVTPRYDDHLKKANDEIRAREEVYGPHHLPR